jgi:hypothetical protein
MATATTQNYKCKLCGKVYGANPGLYTHLKADHPHTKKSTDKRQFWEYTDEPITKRSYRKRKSVTSKKPKNGKSGKIRAKIQGQPVFQNGTIVVQLSLAVPFSVGLPQIIQQD